MTDTYSKYTKETNERIKMSQQRYLFRMKPKGNEVGGASIKGESVSLNSIQSWLQSKSLNADMVQVQIGTDWVGMDELVILN